MRERTHVRDRASDKDNAVQRAKRPANGAIAQLGEHLLCKQGVVGSIPTGSTNLARVKYQHTKDLKSSGIEAGVMFFENKVNE